MDFDPAKLKEALVNASYVSESDYASAETAAKAGGISVAEYLIGQEVITKDLIGQALAESFGVPYADLNSVAPAHEQVLTIPEDRAREFRIVLFKVGKKDVTIATDNPKRDGLAAALKALFPGVKAIIAYSLPEDINQTFLNYQKSLGTRFSQIIAQSARVAPEIFDEILQDAYEFHASDIHLEPQATEVVVRFRVDGVLHEAGRIEKVYYENILNRIKVQSRLRIDEHFAAQDGSMRFERGEKSLDIRTSIVPTVEGEKVVMRLLASYMRGYALSDVGLSEEHQAMLVTSSTKPFGMILVTGPTGSGKTTTLYAVLRSLLSPEVNITTIEDPVEYKVTGINQIQVNPATNLTFAKGLRSIVRQDPDIILVGEIRDSETAEIAVNAALTGHLLLSTFHSNDAATAIPRLLDMDIEPFLLASTLDMIVAQRLVRKICDHCKYSTSIKRAALEKKFPGASKYFPGAEVTLYVGKGCIACGNTGYRGRAAIFEFIQITPAMQELILAHPSTGEIWKLAAKQGAKSLFDDGVDKVKRGTTTIDELYRVAPPPVG